MFPSTSCSNQLPRHDVEPRSTATPTKPSSKRKASETVEGGLASLSLSTLEPSKRGCVRSAESSSSSSSPPDAISVGIGVLNKQIATGDKYKIIDGLNGFVRLVQRGYAYPEAIAAAVSAMEGKYVGLAGRLFEALIEKGQGIKEAIEGGIQRLFSDRTDRHDSNCICELFAALFKKGEGFKEATAAAEENIRSPKEENRIWALQLFKAVVEAGYAPAYKSALAAAIQEIEATDEVEKVVSLLNALVEKKQGLKEAIDVVARRFLRDPSPYDTDRECMVHFFDSLFKKGQGLEPVTAIAEQAMQSPEAMHRRRALQLLIRVVQAGHTPACLVAIAAMIQETKKQHGCKELPLFFALVATRSGLAQGIEEVVMALERRTKSTDAEWRICVLQLFSTAVQAGYTLACPGAIAAATQSIGCEDHYERSFARVLVGHLLRQGHHKAIDVVIAALERRSAVILYEIATLLEELIDDKSRNGFYYPHPAVVHVVNKVKDLELEAPVFNTIFLRLIHPTPKL